METSDKKRRGESGEQRRRPYRKPSLEDYGRVEPSLQSFSPPPPPSAPPGFPPRSYD